MFADTVEPTPIEVSAGTFLTFGSLSKFSLRLPLPAVRFIVGVGCPLWAYAARRRQCSQMRWRELPQREQKPLRARSEKCQTQTRLVMAPARSLCGHLAMPFAQIVSVHDWYELDCCIEI